MGELGFLHRMGAVGHSPSRSQCRRDEHGLGDFGLNRLHLGAQSLTTTSRSVGEIAAEVGYESEPSFNRAFKREFGLPPARFRQQSKAARKRSVPPPSSNGRRSPLP